VAVTLASSSSSPTERILVLCRATPEESSKYFETVCCAGVTDANQLRRLYPVPFKPTVAGGGIPFHKKQWIEAKTGPPDDKRDKRRESRKIDMQSVKSLDRISDQEVYNTIRPLIAPSVKSLDDAGASLGITEPKILDYKIDILDTDLVDDQLQLTVDGYLAPKGKVKLGQESKYFFECEDKPHCWCANQPHQMIILDWEVNELYRHVISKTQDYSEIRAKMRERMFKFMKVRNTFFMLGTHHRWKNWMVIAILYLSGKLSEPLF